VSREQAIEYIQAWLADQEETLEQSKPFREKYGITGADELQRASIQWVLRNPDMHTVCLSLRDFDLIDKLVPLSGTEMTVASARVLEDYRLAYGSHYCRHGCTQCLQACPHRVPVSTIMRYSYYYAAQKRERYAMAKYAALDGPDASQCLSCTAPCRGACPHRNPIQANLVKAHLRLSLA
jgi:predicted aldo/keto reductase-like oxidoreductase